jgi:hypothetical protein
MGVRVRIESAEREHGPEYASPSCWCSCSRGTCAAGELPGGVPSRLTPVDDLLGTSYRCPYVVHSFHCPSLLCYVDAAASLSDLKRNNKHPIKFLNTIKYGVGDFIVNHRLT